MAAAAAAAASPVNPIGDAKDFEYSLTCLGAGYVGGPTMVRAPSHLRCPAIGLGAAAEPAQQPPGLLWAASFDHEEQHEG
jgi:hypothetical protein